MPASPSGPPRKDRRRPGIFQKWRAAADGPFEQAPPQRLIALLCEVLVGALGLMVRAINEGQADEKAEQLVRVLAILHGLETSLDFQEGGAVARKLAQTYRRLRRDIISASQENDPKRIEAARMALADLAEAWRAL